jgi:hypothetical protein
MELQADIVGYRESTSEYEAIPFLDELSRGAQGKPAVMGPWCIA